MTIRMSNRSSFLSAECQHPRHNISSVIVLSSGYSRAGSASTTARSSDKVMGSQSTLCGTTTGRILATFVDQFMLASVHRLIMTLYVFPLPLVLAECRC